MPPIIEITNLSKQYHIGKRESYKTLRDTIVNAVKAPLRMFSKNGAEEDSTIWALKDVSFEVNEGEVLGIIGRNGAGKSTLLKILSRITEPTSGEIKIRGRVGSLLEVGTGFHPELTGRENIFLNGAILGMRREEIKKKFDEIVAFAEIEKFLDTPVKRYSSGMYVRLAFAVAAHLEPEVLVVDEVLAVGDAGFQKKCMGKMGEVAKGGRTVLFVSHNMGAVRKLCAKAVLLDGGHIKTIGSAEEVIADYLTEYSNNISPVVECPNVDKDAPGAATRLSFFTQDGIPHAQFRLGEPWQIVLDFEIVRPIPHVIAAIGITNLESLPLITYWTKPRDLMPGKYRAVFEFNLPLAATELQIGVGLSSQESAFYYVQNICNVSISDVAIGKQPLRSRGAGILCNVKDSEIMLIREI
ncbi:MAG: hypothetical protein A2W23_03695 [Planctomycetes bacterium RBG_16_43_13]|nr:MAG: hypothetical protein A2W23_03695 [Planctomycetes bacterium RBG_16_43_13]